MRLWWRAVVAVVLLAGFYLLALLLVAGLTLIVLWVGRLQQGPSAMAVAVAVVSMVVVTVAATVRAMRSPNLPPALELRETDAPGLWRMVRTVAERAGTTAPQHIRLTATANAWVTEEARLLGRWPGQRYLDIGVPLLPGLDTAQFEAVLAHELGHYCNRDTRLGALVYRGRHIIEDVAEGLGWAPLRAVVSAYLDVYWSVSATVLRRQEWAADRIAAEIAGPAALAGALRRLPVLDRMWTSYLDERVGLPDGYGYAPDDICGGFADYLHANRMDLTNPSPVETPRPGDTHPPLAERIAALENTASIPAPDPSPASSLLPNLREYGPALDLITFALQGRVRLPFAEYAVTVAARRAAEREHLLYRQAGCTRLTEVLDLLGTGGARMLAARIARAQGPGPDPDTTAHTLAEHLEAAMTATAVRAGVALWRYSWAGGVELVDAAGQRFGFTDDLDVAGSAAAAAAGSRAHLDALRSRLAGADSPAPDLGPVPEPTLHGAAVPVAVNGHHCDLVILSTALLVLPGNREEGADQRLRQYAAAFQDSRRPPEHGWPVEYHRIRAARLLHRTKANLRLVLDDDTTLVIEETRETRFLACRPEDPRQMLRDLAAVGSDDGSGQDTGRVTVPARLTLTAPDSETGARIRTRTVTGWLNLATALLLLLLAVGSDTSPLGLFAGAAAAGAGGTLLLVWARLERVRGRSRGTGFLVCGSLVAATFTVLATLTRPVPLLWFLAGYGALLAGLGLARRRGRWPAREGNALKVAAGAPAALAAGGAASNLADGQAPAMAAFLIPAVLLYLAGVALARVRTADTATIYGVMGILLVIAPPVGLVFSAMSIHHARKTGARPTLGLAGAGVTLVLCAALAVVARVTG